MREINYKKIIMLDEKEIKLSTAPILLLKLRSTDKKAYKSLCNKLYNGLPTDDIVSFYEFAHCAYLNASQGENDLLDLEGFIDQWPLDMAETSQLVVEMINPPKKPDLESLSQEE